MLLLILGIELIALYFLSGALSKHMYRYFLLLFRVRSIAVSILLAIQFPGTVLHELAHLFTAEILGVKTGKLRLEPESIREDNIQAGSVMVAESDPFRRYMIGLAPLFWGMTVLVALSYVIPPLYVGAFSSGLSWFTQHDFYLLLGVGYLLFAVSNTMFPSPEDTHGITPFLIAITGLLILGFLLGLRFELAGAILDLATTMMTTLTKSLGVVIGLNIILLLLTFGLSALVSRVFRIRLA